MHPPGPDALPIELPEGPEARRLRMLHRLGILDTPPDERFDVFTRLAASVARVPVATISLVDQDRVWFKSSRGLPEGVTELPRDIAACSHILSSPDDVLVVPDARLDPRLRDSPLVTSEFGMRFYAGAPLKGPNGEVLGSLCVIDRTPREPDAETIQAMRDLAEGVSNALRIHEMSALALRDSLTGLGNRHMFEESVASAVEAARRTDRGEVVAVALIDLDRFKSFNDIIGHAGGDHVLRVAGQRLAGALRKGDVAARLGGDEFAALVSLPSGVDPVAGMREVADRILLAFREEPLRIESHEMRLTASIGMELLHIDPAIPTAETVAALMRGADVALFNAKHAGRGRAAFFHGDAPLGIGSKHTLATDLRAVLAAGGQGLRLVLQPLRPAADTMRISGYEALVRWTHDTYGPVPPNSFVPVAERSGLAPALDGWVLNEACRILAGFAEPRPLIAVNITPSFLVSSSFLETVESALARHGIAPDRLCIELTERVVLDDLDVVRQRTQALIARGVQVAIDDFGAGQASFGTLTAISVNKVKLDRSISAGIGSPGADGTRAAAVARGIIAMCHELGCTVVIEGVETAMQLAILRDLGADEVQGWHTGRPAPPEHFLGRPLREAA